MVACTNQANKNANSSTAKKSDTSNSFVKNVDDSRINLPAELRLDTLNQFDSVKNTEIFIQYPLSLNRVAEYDKQIKKILNNQLDDFQKQLTVDNDTLMANNFYVRVVSAYIDTAILNYCFTISTYTSNAVHPFTIFYSFNYDLKKNWQIFFADYFDLKNKSDTSTFKSILNSANNRPNDFGINYLDNVCFNPKRDSIIFLFDDFYKKNDATEITKVIIPKTKIRTFLKYNYR